MNKKLMAVAVAGALTAPGLAVAQVGGSPGVSLYGRIDTAVMIEKFSSPSATVSDLKKNDIFSPGNALGVRGREDLGGGTAAWFQLEPGVWPDGRLDGALTNGQISPAIRRQSAVAPRPARTAYRPRLIRCRMTNGAGTFARLTTSLLATAVG